MSVTFVMYHYVRDLKRSRYPDIKGMTVEEFSGQLRWLSRHHTFLTYRDLIALRNGDMLAPPSNAAVLTFDDGYIDHFHTVFPMLHEAGIQGFFFPPAKAVLERRVLDVNKIHYILSSVENKAQLVEGLKDAITNAQNRYGLGTFEEYWAEHGKPSRFDTAEVIFIKRLLQKVLPAPARAAILDDMFHRFVAVAEFTLANELYMTIDQLRTMVRCGMYVGSHGYEHSWMDTLSPEEQQSEIERSLEFLSAIGAPTVDWVMCYPYGATNDGLVAVLEDRQCAFGLTTEVGRALDLRSNPYRLPRMDTNDFPKFSSYSGNVGSL